MQKDFVFIIIGDFNINIRVNNQNSNLLQQYMQSLQMQKITHNFVRKGKYVIDHIWTNLQIEQCEIHILDAYWSDHDIVHALLHFV